MEFFPAAYTVNEGEVATFTVQLSSASTSEVTVLFSTQDGTAAGNNISSTCIVCHVINTCYHATLYMYVGEESGLKLP